MPHTDCKTCGLHSRPGEEVHTVECTNQAVQTANQVVGRIIDLDRYRTPIQPECGMCKAYRKAIKDYLRTVKQEAEALDKLRAVLGE